MFRYVKSWIYNKIQTDAADKIFVNTICAHISQRYDNRSEHRYLNKTRKWDGNMFIRPGSLCLVGGEGLVNYTNQKLKSTVAKKIGNCFQKSCHYFKTSS